MEKGKTIKNTFIIPINHDFLVYSPLTGISALLNHAAVSELRKQMQLIDENKGIAESKLFELAEDIMQSQLQEPARKTGSLNPDFLGIIPTRSCNAACNYCDFGVDKTENEKMSYKMATKAVDWYADLLKSNQRKLLEVHFFGGEPMLALDVIEVVVHRARLLANENNLMPFFEILTNGQYSAKSAKFLGQYFNKVILSFDGFKEVQNKHRPLKGNKSSFENVFETAKIISDSNAELCLRTCVSQLNISQMEEITDWFCRTFKVSVINFEILTTNSLTENSNLFAPNPIEFAVNFQKSRKVAKKYGVELVYAPDISEQPQLSSCPVGKDTAIFSPDGRISNCYLIQEDWQKVGLDFDIGKIAKTGKVKIENKKNEAIRKMIENKPRCNSCFCKWSCAGACHVGNTYQGCSLDYDNYCEQNRLISVFTLLSNLGMEEKIEELICNQEAMESIINQKSDSIIQFKS